MIVVSDATPLIHLSRIGALYLIEELYGRCCITWIVYDETVVEGRKYGHPDSYPIADATGDWLEIRDPDGDAALLVSRYSIHVGEATSILLARELGSLLLINERNGREAAKGEGVPVKGTIGIIADSVKKKMIDVTTAVEMLDRFASDPGEFWLDPVTVREAVSRITKIGERGD